MPILLEVLLVGGRACGGVVLVVYAAWNTDDWASLGALGVESLLHVQLSVAPSPDRGIGAEKQQGDASEDEHDERYDEREPPCLTHGITTCNEGVVDGRHDEIGDATAGITPTTGQGICGTNHVLVEESSGPYEAGHETSTQDPDKESTRI